jgi:hypothetical protein
MILKGQLSEENILANKQFMALAGSFYLHDRHFLT